MTFATRSRIFSAARAAVFLAALTAAYAAYRNFEDIAELEDYTLNVAEKALALQQAWAGNRPGGPETAHAALGEAVSARAPDRPAFTELRRQFYALPRPAAAGNGNGRAGPTSAALRAAVEISRLATGESRAALLTRNQLLIRTAINFFLVFLLLLVLEAVQHYLYSAPFFFELTALKTKLSRYASPFYTASEAAGELEELSLAADALDITLENSMLARIRLAKETALRQARMKNLTHTLELTRRKVISLVEDLEAARAELQQEKKALKLTGEKLARSNKELEQFAYVASHDLKEPLRIVSSFSGLLTKRYSQALDGDARDFINYIDHGAQRATELVNALFNYSKVTYSAREFTAVDCGTVLEKALFNLKIAIDEKRAAVRHSGLPSVHGDEFQLIQLFQNLVSNALKFNTSPAPEITVSATKSGEGEWVLHFADNGIGIPREHFDRIFLIFQRLHTVEKYPGAGIGLALCKKIAENHGGKIWVESETGRGSVFHLSLPAADRAAAAAQAGPEGPGREEPA